MKRPILFFSGTAAQDAFMTRYGLGISPPALADFSAFFAASPGPLAAGRATGFRRRAFGQ